MVQELGNRTIMRSVPDFKNSECLVVIRFRRLEVA